MVEKHWQTKYIILSPGVDNAPAVGNPLYNASGILALPTNAVAIYGPVAGSGNHQETSATPGDAIQIIKRRNTAGDKSPLYTRLFEQSDWINAFCRKGLIISGTAAETGSNSSQLLGAENTATTGKIQVSDNLNYQVQVSGHGDRTDWFNSSYSTPTTFGFYQAPNFTALGIAENDARDLIAQELTLDFNNKARMMSFAVCVDSAATAAGADVLTLAAVAALPVGTEVLIGYDKQGRRHTFVMNKTMQESFLALSTAAPAGAVMKPYVTPGTTGLTPAQIAAAGGVAGTALSECDHMYFMALDEGQAAYDYRVNTKRRIEVGPVAGFTGTSLVEISKAYEGQGQFHQLDIQYRMHNRYEETHRSRFPHQSYYLEFNNSGLKEDATYDYFVIEHCDDRTATSGMPSNNNFRTIVAVVSFEDVSTPYYNGTPGVPGTGTPNPQKTYIQNALNLFITNNNLSIPALAI